MPKLRPLKADDQPFTVVVYRDHIVRSGNDQPGVLLCQHLGFAWVHFKGRDYPTTCRCESLLVEEPDYA